MRVAVEQIEGRRFRIRARGVEAIVDDTIENGGPGDGFRPTELLMGALGACMAGTMLNFARNQNIPVRGIWITVEEETAEHPQRVAKLTIDMTVAADTTERQVDSLRRVATGCKIHNTLEREPEIAFGFRVAR